MLSQTASASTHLIQIRDREQPHVHAVHDLTVSLLRGSGTVYLHGVPYKMSAGDVLFIPRSTPHYFVNGDSEPTAAFVTFAPPYDGKDQVPVPR